MPEKPEFSPKVEQKRQRILRFALKIFAKEGFRNTDVQVIADMAKVGKGTVYRHFGNKEQLFLATAKNSLEQLGQYVEEKLGGEDQVGVLVQEHGTPELLRRIAIHCAEFYQSCPQAVEIMIQERAEFRESVFPSHLMFRAETRAAFDELLRIAIERGELRKMDVIEASNAFGDLIYGSAVNGCLEGAKANLVQRVEHAIDILLNGMVNTQATNNSPDTPKQ